MSMHNEWDLDGQIQRLSVPGISDPISDYVDVVRAGDLAFISGMGPFAEDGSVVARGDVAGQTEQVLGNMQTALEALDASFENVMKVTVYLTDVRDRQAVNEVRRRYFGPHWPASTLFGVARLPINGMLVEIEAVAYVPES